MSWQRRGDVMRAVDTNIVVRYLTGDDQAQASRAKAVLDAGQVFVSTTVLLESEWVLRSAYGFATDEIAAALRALAGLPGLFVENPSLLAEALHGVERGMDFADALHLGASSSCDAFLTFDRRLINLARDAATIHVTEP